MNTHKEKFSLWCEPLPNRTSPPENEFFIDNSNSLINMTPCSSKIYNFIENVCIHQKYINFRKSGQIC